MKFYVPYYVYALSNPLTLEIGYIGVTYNLRHRFMTHVVAVKKSLITGAGQNFCYLLRRQNLAPSLEVLETTTYVERLYREFWWVKNIHTTRECTPEYKAWAEAAKEVKEPRTTQEDFEKSLRADGETLEYLVDKYGPGIYYG